jgi:hypothetical protein
MDARIAGQLGGIGHPIPTRGESPVGDARTQTVDAVKRAAVSSAAADAQADLSDTNGDGTVEHWSYAHGGDSVTTFKPPPSGAVGANVRKVGHPPRGSTPPPPPAQGAHHTNANAHASTTAAVHHAHEAYQRDGGASAPDTRAAAAVVATTPSAPAPVKAAAAAPALTQTGSTAPLPSTR